LKSIFPFEYENKTYRLVNNYVASPWTKCAICTNYPIKEVSVIRSNDGRELRIGNKCLDLLTNRKVSVWFGKFRTKRENVNRNKKYVDGLDSILAAYRNSELVFQILKNDLAILEKALRLMCNGFNPTRKQEKLVKCYISMSDCN